MPTRSPLDNIDQDSRYNPDDIHYQETIAGGYVGSGTDQAETFANDPENASAKGVDGAEKNPSGGVDNGYYRPDGNPLKPQQRVTFKSIFKKKGPLGVIIAVLLGGGGLASIVLVPGLGIVHLKETMVGDLNDQFAAFDIRSDHMFKAKLKNLQASASICSSSVKIRCKFATMTDKQVKRFVDAGFTVETEDRPFGRKVITSLTLPDSDRPLTNPQDLMERRNDPNVRSAINKVHNPYFASFSDSKFGQVLKGVFGISKKKQITATTPEGISEEIGKKTAGASVRTDSVKTGPDKNGDQSRYYEDGNGTKIFESEDPDAFKKLEDSANKITSGAEQAKESGTKAVTGVLSGAAKGLLITGIADSACTVYNTANAVAAASKAIRSVQLAQYSMVFLGTADAIKAGEATPEEVSYLGNILTATDTEKRVINDSGVEVDNPNYGKNGFDSPGFQVAAYNAAPTLTTESQQFMVGGGLSGTLSGVMDNITAGLSLGIDSGRAVIRNTCATIQNPVVRAVGLIGGVALSIGSFGVGTALMAGGSVAISLALPFLEAMLADMVAGKVVDKDTKGTDSGNAIFAGTATVMGTVAQNRGMKPLTEAELQPYLALSDKVENEYIAQARFEAKETPLDIMNQYSFLGSFARSLVPISSRATESTSGLLASIPKLLSAPFTQYATSVKAASFNPDRFTKCDDMGYEELGIAADVFCNVRYGLSPQELALDPEVVLEFMIAGNHITGEGKPKSDTYKNFIKNCVERVDGWGETSVEGGDVGIDCMTVSDQNSYFRVYTFDKTVNDAMDDEVKQAGTQATIEIDFANLLADSSDIECAAGTDDAGIEDGYVRGTLVKVRLCAIPGANHTDPDAPGTVRVNSRISGAFIALYEKMNAELGSARIADSFRTMAEQQAAYDFYGPGRAATPGFSNHQMGLAIDFQLGSNNGATRPGDPVYDWLVANAASFSFQKLDSESWHWEVRQ